MCRRVCAYRYVRTAIGHVRRHFCSLSLAPLAAIFKDLRRSPVSNWGAIAFKPTTRIWDLVCKLQHERQALGLHWSRAHQWSQSGPHTVLVSYANFDINSKFWGCAWSTFGGYVRRDFGYVRLVCAQVCAPSQLEMAQLEMSAIGNECCVCAYQHVHR